MALTDEIEYIKLYQKRQLLFHGYVAPFIILYGIAFYTWIFVYGVKDHVEIGCIACAVIGVVQVLTCLFCHWSVHVRCALTCSAAIVSCYCIFTVYNRLTTALAKGKQEKDPNNADVIKVVPTPNNGSPELVPINHEQDSNHEKESIWFEFQKIKYFYDPDEKKQFRSVDFPVNNSFGFYQDNKGFQDEDDITVASRKYGPNRIDMTVPEFIELFKERATAPFFVFQVFCVGLWCLDEYWYYSVFTLFMLVIFEATLVQQQLRNMKEIRKMSSKPFQIQVYRHRKWRPVASDELLPGDICSVGRSKSDLMVPCDMLLLRGSCIIDESMLTGESVPQMKENIETLPSNEFLEIENNGKLHMLYSGTKVVNHTPPPKASAGLKAPDNGCVAYVLRTGFNTSQNSALCYNPEPIQDQGKLLKTILYGVKRVTANNLETFMFILFLLIFAISAASYVWIKGTEDPKRNRYKLFLECTLILTSVVPPELPIELSLAVNSSLLALSKLGVFCTEPFRIPFAGKVDICCFDKTGTLTSDNLVVEGVAGVNGNEDIASVESVPMETTRVLASCHALTYVDDSLVGDPQEKALLQAVDWNLTKGDICLPKKGQRQSLKIEQRFHFSSALKRMSVIISMQLGIASNSQYLVTAKGAPETLKAMFLEVPSDYDKLHRKLSCEGGRVLALGYKVLGEISIREARDISREEAESGLKFAGFAVLSCPLKPDSESTIKEIQESSHHIVMITGDNPLTACHVARELRLTQKPLLILTRVSVNHANEDLWQWQSADGGIQFPLFPEKMRLFLKDHDICLTGEGLSFLLEDEKTRKLLRQVLIHVKVYARVDPKQKELIVNKLKSEGFVVLMCGDGTNDVGALKHSHVGVALLPGTPEKWEDLQKKEKEKKKDQAAEEGKEHSKKMRPHASGKGSSKAAKARAVARGDTESPVLKTAQDHQKRLKDLLKELEEGDQSQVVKLGDASIASPFTSRFASILCICHVIRQGRCTLVTTLQMFKILALNALILAYSQSVLYLEGIKFSDGQATLQGILLAGCFLFISRSKPLKVLSKKRPLPNIFNVYTIITVLLQFAVHFACLVYLVQEAYKITPKKEGHVDLEKKFEPSLINSTVYIISVSLQIATFAINYKGHPFMESLYENKPLLYSLVMSWLAVLCLSQGWLPDFSKQFEIIEFPHEFKAILLQVLVLDMLACLVVDRILQFICGTATLRTK